MAVAFTDLKLTFELHQEEYEEALLSSLRSGWYILGEQLEKFEKEFAHYLGIKHCIGCGCGQDALTLAVRSLGLGSGNEVVVAGNTFIASVLAVTENKATPVFVDCNEYFEIDESKIESVLTGRTKAILLTNLYGQCCNLPAIRDICDKNGLKLIEDCAQSHGARFHDVLGGTAGDVSCFSFYPTKPLGAFGDGGAIVTDDDSLAEKLRMLRNYGSREKYVNEICGTNSRLDELQAAVLRVGLRHLDESNSERIRIASRYLREIKNPLVELPKTREGADHVFHVFALRTALRDELRKYLADCGIQTQIHYPFPPNQAQCYATESFAAVDLPNTDQYAKEELSLPIYCGMPEEDVDQVIAAVNSFTGGFSAHVL
ncbi:DegT/DnrJ/EryC1/StrS family aminotransferase [Eggerthella guodeyinii]|uniref:DegT/DnrJ/EryC1/StrS family aminotransferase n=1 Tax=Eggerthella guodeyinii TaxID=2690837 RepID=A0A6L7IXT9_9ACTN|nr:DegT/DnrJ/EryC1/StrS family aminotransferase [Eggerthella guodeyinii]QOS67610.1 DegT/DnrJ/EryC1/StrS family aminotransferase [Eggerthella guodeyinii]